MSRLRVGLWRCGTRATIAVSRRLPFIPEIYKMFIILTKGEQTAYCAQPGCAEGVGEAPPTP